MTAPAPRLIVLADLDGTAAAQNVAETLLERFGAPSWREHRVAFRRGELTLREYQERAFNGVQATLAEMSAALDGLCWPRAGFAEFARYCADRDIDLAIMTNGLQFYADALLAHAGLERVRVYAVGAAGPPGRLVYAYPYETAACQQWGNCKCRIVDEQRARGAPVVVIGDGASDHCAARRADAAIARDIMLARCRAEGMAAIPFEDFHDVLAAFERGIPGVWVGGASA